MTLWPKWLNFLRSFQNHLGLWPKKKTAWRLVYFKKWSNLVSIIYTRGLQTTAREAILSMMKK